MCSEQDTCYNKEQLGGICSEQDTDSSLEESVGPMVEGEEVVKEDWKGIS